MSVLAYAFEKLDLRDRAGTRNCIALVCTSWAAAAAAATRSIELSRCTNTDSLQQWLRSRGSHVIKAKLRIERGIITSLPCPRLERLVLKDISVDLRPGSQLLQDLSAAAALEHLQLDDVVFQGEPDRVAVLLSCLPCNSSTWPMSQSWAVPNNSKQHFLAHQQQCRLAKSSPTAFYGPAQDAHIDGVNALQMKACGLCASSHSCTRWSCTTWSMLQQQGWRACTTCQP